jgi:hypothetical protein
MLVARAAVADPPPATSGTRVAWRILENHDTDPTHFSSRFEVVARAPDGATQRVGPFRLPCAISTQDDVLTCGYASAFDYLRIRRAGGACVVEAQRSTEHGMGPRRVLGRFRCRGPLQETVERVDLPDGGR